MKNLTVKYNPDGPSTVQSGDNTYAVKFCGRGDDGDSRLWECNCSAGKYGRICKHIQAVADANEIYCQEHGYE